MCLLTTLLLKTFKKKSPKGENTSTVFWVCSVCRCNLYVLAKGHLWLYEETFKLHHHYHQPVSGEVFHCNRKPGRLAVWLC